MKPRARTAPLVSAALALVVLAVITWKSLAGTGGRITYVLDDAYIHMAVAKNLVEHGVWGVTSHGFTSVSSSILWVLLIAAADLILGIRDLIPLGLNLVASVLAIVLLDRAVRRTFDSTAPQVVLVLILFVLSGIPALVFTGLEHVAHIAASLLLLDRAVALLGDGPNRRRDPWLLLVAAAVVTSLRYEGIFLVVVVAGLLAIRRRWIVASASVGSALFPVTLLGLVARAHGWHFLPNSILLKSNKPALQLGSVLDWLLTSSYRHIIDTPILSFLLLFGLAAFLFHIGRSSFWERGPLQLAIVVPTAFLHMQFSSLSWFMRYETYLITLCLVALLPAGAAAYRYWCRPGPHSVLRSMSTRGPALALLALFPLLPLANRALLSSLSIPAAARNIFEQQVQMGLFCHRFYPGAAVAANDIGAICYFADIRCLDIWGLASLDVCDAKLESLHQPQAGLDLVHLDRWMRQSDVQVLIAYEKVLQELGDPSSGFPWVRVGSWKIANNVVCAEDRVDFYAPDTLRAATLRRNLVEFQAELPPTVTQEGGSLD